MASSRLQLAWIQLQLLVTGGDLALERGAKCFS